ncbi:LysM peptidoglycan-binding domain-containing protein [Roseovarius sp. LXJ103]|nr:LysM peptidoglycan-binding domain-containing protein [Roseovarius carneus]PWE37135.1 peptidoglycan-binding protein [Pelagicola sp. LXJ1103]
MTGGQIAAGGAALIAVVFVVLYAAGVWTPAAVQAPDEVAQIAAPEPATTEPATPDASEPAPPSVDVFRLEPGGNALIAGSAAPGWSTTILIDGAEIAAAATDAAGQFVQFLTLEPSDAPRVLTLVMRAPETGREIQSEAQIIIAPNTAPMPPSTAEAVDGADGTAQTVLLSAPEGISVLQTPTQVAGPGPDVMSSVALDAITYSDVGEVQLSGRAAGTGEIRVYLDNRPVITSRISDAGAWRTDLPQVDTGVYTLRIDEIAADGTVTSRIETPFQREDEAVLATAQTAQTAVGADGQTVRAVTVQPGSTLWAISREAYGEGLAFVRVFEANRDRIRDPDLIYPGQVFTLPE